MGKELFEKRKLEFKKTILTKKELPKLNTVRFTDGEDQRLWYDSLKRIPKEIAFIKEIESLLSTLNKQTMTDEERKEIFLDIIIRIKRVPNQKEYYFSDNVDMKKWYLDYTKKDNEFVYEIKKHLPENINFDHTEINEEDIQALKNYIKDKKRLPKYHEAKTERGIDFRVIYDKLETSDPIYCETVMHFLASNKKDSLSPESKKDQFLTKVKELKYIPILQECRFTDNTDMFIWYQRYKNIFPNLEEEVNNLINEPVNKKLNIYLIPNFKNKGGKFYTICSNIGEKLDISEITTFEELQKLDNTVKKSGGIIIKQDEEIASITLGGKKR